MQRAGWLIGGMLAAVLTLSGCGVRGNLQSSEEAKAAKAAERTAPATVAKPGEPIPPKPHKPFILDDLIR